jgi:putative endopeptidase
MAYLFVGVGFTLAREISHGFDYLGSQLDGAGEPSPVFVDADAERFIEKCTKLADYYSSIEIEPGLNIDGDAVKSEAAADLSGMQAILVLAEESDDIDIEEMLRQMAKIWAQVAPETLLYALLADTHPLNYLRVNVSAQMYESVYETFGITEDDGMYLAPENRIVFWGDDAA